MGYLSEDILGNLDEMVLHLSKRCELFAQAKPYFSQTEVGATMNNILLSIRRLEYIIKIVSDKQRRSLLKVISFKINKVHQAFGHISSDLKLALKADIKKVDVDDSEWIKLIKSENESPIFTIRDDDEEYNNARRLLMSRVKNSYSEAQKRIEHINELIEDIEDQEEKIEKDEKLQRTLYNIMLDDYRRDEWPSDYRSFVKQINRVIKCRKNILGILETELDNLCRRHLNSYKPSPVERLYNSVIDDGIMPFKIIKKYREKLSKEEISDYFAFLHKYSTLKEHIDSIPLLEPLTNNYNNLFINKAAKEYVDLLSPALLMYGGIQEKGHFPILLMVMRDLRLSPVKNTQFAQMKDYANEINTKDEELKFTSDHSIFSKMFGWLGKGKSFCELEYGDVGDTQFTNDKIEEYQKVYWRCFKILNQHELRMPKEIKTASYLQNIIPDFNMSVVMEDFSAAQLIRLHFLRSTLRGETLVFG